MEWHEESICSSHVRMGVAWEWHELCICLQYCRASGNMSNLDVLPLVGCSRYWSGITILKAGPRAGPVHRAGLVIIVSTAMAVSSTSDLRSA